MSSQPMKQPELLNQPGSLSSIDTKLHRLSVQLRELQETVHRKRYPSTMRIASGVMWGMVFFTLFMAVVGALMTVLTASSIAAILAGLAGGGGSGSGSAGGTNQRETAPHVAPR